MNGNALETALILALNLPGDVSQQSMEDIHPLKVIYQPRILSLALLEEVIFVQDSFKRDVLLVEQTVDGRSIMEPESARKIK